MIVTDNLIYIHMPKTAGSFVTHLLIDHCGGVSHGAHIPASEIPPELRKGRTVFRTTRPRKDWYESWYRHASSGLSNERTRHKLGMYGFGSTDFRWVLFGLTHLLYLEMTPDRDPFWNPVGDTDTWAWGATNLYDVMRSHYFGSDDDGRPAVDVDVPVSELSDGLAALTGLGAAFIAGLPHRNTAKAPPQGWDAEMLAWVNP